MGPSGAGALAGGAIGARGGRAAAAQRGGGGRGAWPRAAARRGAARGRPAAAERGGVGAGVGWLRQAPGAASRRRRAPGRAGAARDGGGAGGGEPAGGDGHDSGGEGGYSSGSGSDLGTTSTSAWLQDVGAFDASGGLDGPPVGDPAAAAAAGGRFTGGARGQGRSPRNITVRFSVPYEVSNSNQHLCVAGSHEPLGWSFLAINKVPMQLLPGTKDVWYADVPLPEGELVEYKYCVVESQPWANPGATGKFYAGTSAIVRWQPGTNMRVLVPSATETVDTALFEYGAGEGDAPHSFERCDYWGK